MRVYTVHLRRPGPDEDLVLVREGFNGWAFLFGAVWALAGRLWLFAAALVAAQAAIAGLVLGAGLNAAGETALALALALITGYLANDMKRRRLDALGYRDMGVVAAPDLDGATARFLDAHPMVAARMMAAPTAEGRP